MTPQEGLIPKIAEGRPKSATETALKVPGMAFAGVVSAALALDRVHYNPIKVETPITINQVTIEVTTAAAAGKKCLVGIYKADKNWQPTSLVVASAAIAIDSVAVVNTAITATVLAPGRYLIAITLQATATFRQMRYSTLPFGCNPSFGGTPVLKTLYVGKTYAALANPGTAWDTTGYDAGDNPTQPVLLNVSVP